jgi:predicted transcriptional regulator
MSTGDSTVLTLRVPPELDRKIAAEARRRRRTKSEILREVLQSAFQQGRTPEDPIREARRQSLLVSGRASEREAVRFVSRVADTRGWR